jgi:hypothetical protein
MATLAVKMEIPHATNVNVDEDTLTVELDDGRTVSVPIAWYPRLLNASKKERDNWRLIGKGHGINWEALDEDISVEGILAGRPSGESQISLKNWLESRNKEN